MNKDPVVRPYRSGDEKEIIKLLELVFDGYPHKFDVQCSPLDFWRWKFEGCPFGQRNIYVAEYDSKIIATEGRNLTHAKIGGSRIKCEHRVDLATHPDFRRQGLFNKIRENLNRTSSDLGVKLSYAFESNPIVMKRWGKAGAFQPVHRLINFVWINDLTRFIKTRHLKYPFPKTLALHLFKIISQLRKAPSEKKQNINSWVISAISQFDDSVDDFWSIVSKGYDFIIERTKDYLNWRYCDHRVGPYIVNIASESQKILGYSILRVTQDWTEYPVGYIVDLLALPGRNDVADSLIRESLKFFENADVNEVCCWMVANHPYKTLIQKHCFLDLRKNVYFDFFQYGLDSKTLDNIIGKGKKIYLALGDSDWI